MGAARVLKVGRRMIAVKVSLQRGPGASGLIPPHWSRATTLLMACDVTGTVLALSVPLSRDANGLSSGTPPARHSLEERLPASSASPCSGRAVGL